MEAIFSAKNSWEEKDYSVEETVYVFENEDEDFELYSHSEQLSVLGLSPEEKTPSSVHGDVTRYYIDVSDLFIFVRKVRTFW